MLQSYNVDDEVNAPLVGYRESALNFNIAYSLNKRHNAGLQKLGIKTAGSAYNYNKEINNYFLAGIFYQYDHRTYRRSDCKGVWFRIQIAADHISCASFSFSKA